MIISCDKINREHKVNKEELLSSDYRIFQDTPAWELAKAVWDEDIDEIKKEVKKNPTIINYQDTIYGKTILHLSIYNDNYKGFRELLKLGANPNISDSLHCTSPLVQVALSNSKINYAEDLIKYGANVNYAECNKGKEEQKTNTTPLIAASIQNNLQLVELLIKSGADINYINANDEYALSSAVLSKNYGIILYLLVNGADCSNVLYKKGGEVNPQDIYIKDWIKNEADYSAKEFPKIKELLYKKGCL